MGFVNKNMVVLVLGLFMVTRFWGTSMADPRTNIVRQFCNTTLALSGAALAINFVPAMDNLSSSVNENGFGTSITGEGPNAVFGLAQCFRDLNPIDCRLCFSEIRSVLPKCYPRTGGKIFLDGCFGRYENYSFFHQGTDSDDTKVCSNKNSTSPDKFKATVTKVIMNVSSKAQSNGGFVLCKAHKNLYGSELSAAITQSKLNFRYQELTKATKNFDVANKLGQGSYGTVYKGVLSNGKEVAVKRLFLNTREWINQFFNEVNLINQVRHRNLVKLLGCSIDGPESLLVYEYYFNKSLDQFIFDANKAKSLDWQKRFDIIQGIAEGLSYLHEESEIKIIHRDIKAGNILLDDKLKPKITDFGLARSFVEDQTHLTTGAAGTIGYMAPEYIVHGHLTEKADVYSFGVLVLEIVTGTRCSTGMGTQEGQFFLSKIWNHYKAKTVYEIVDRSFYDEEMKDHILHVVNVGLMCTQETSSYRPTMTKVVELLRNSYEYNDKLIPSPPPFLDILVMGDKKEGEDSQMLTMTSTASYSSGSSKRQVSAR